MRNQFVTEGKLSNSLSTSFSSISDGGIWPVFAFAHDIGNVTETTDPVVFTVGHARDPVVQYITSVNGLMQNQSAYFWSKYSDIADVVCLQEPCLLIRRFRALMYPFADQRLPSGLP